jgi:CheY-like chemotaxis protein
MFRLQASAKGIAFLFERPEYLPLVVRTDQKRLRQILINLLSNAIKFTDVGRVVLRIRYRTQMAEIEVEDSGIGIAEADLKRVFDPFERVYAADGPTRPGVGLGLTITKLLTEIMGGEIFVTSVLGQGSLFRLKLLLAEVPRPDLAAAAEARIRGYLGRQRTLLTVDDDPVHRDLLHAILTPLGFALFEASDGRAALALAAECKPDLVLLDISMPGMDGWAVARELCQAGPERPAVVIVSAGAAEPERAMRELHDDFLAKPIGIPQLLSTIARLLRIEWVRDAPAATALHVLGASDAPAPRHMSELRRLGRIGHIRGIQAKLDEIVDEAPDRRAFVDHMRALVADVNLAQYMAALDGMDGGDA